MTPNLHHLELFFHVARSGGITAASRSISYGVQQPAISGQIARLEAELGVKLFQRRPFELTPEGRELYEFVAPFFESLPEIAAKIAGRASRRLRIAAPATVIRRHLPDVIAAVRRSVPDLELTLADTGQRGAFALLESGGADLAVCELEGKPPAGTHAETLLTMPLMLLLPESYEVPRSGMHGMAVQLPLIRPPAETAMSRLFAQALARASLEWPSSIEVNSLELVHAYVAGGFGAGLSVKAPGVVAPKGTRPWPVPDCRELSIAAVWKGTPTPLAKLVLEGLRRKADPSL